MRTLEYTCDCGETLILHSPVGAGTEDPFCHCGQLMQWTPTKVPTAYFTYTVGKESGVYENDWGRRATYDLTVPGKLDKLQRDGRVPVDPFTTFDDEVRSGKRPRYNGPGLDI
jgi:hypothetical protein